MLVSNFTSHNKEIRHTVVFKNTVYTEAPKMDSKRQLHSAQGPKRKIRKIVHLSPEVEQLLRCKDVTEARLQVRHDGDRVFLSIRQPAPYRPEIIQNYPRNETRPKPIRPAGR